MPKVPRLERSCARCSAVGQLRGTSARCHRPRAPTCLLGRREAASCWAERGRNRRSGDWLPPWGRGALSPLRVVPYLARSDSAQKPPGNIFSPWRLGLGQSGWSCGERELGHRVGRHLPPGLRRRQPAGPAPSRPRPSPTLPAPGTASTTAGCGSAGRLRAEAPLALLPPTPVAARDAAGALPRVRQARYRPRPASVPLQAPPAELRPSHPRGRRLARRQRRRRRRASAQPSLPAPRAAAALPRSQGRPRAPLRLSRARPPASRGSPRTSAGGGDSRAAPPPPRPAPASRPGASRGSPPPPRDRQRGRSAQPQLGLGLGALRNVREGRATLFSGSYERPRIAKQQGKRSSISAAGR